MTNWGIGRLGLAGILIVAGSLTNGAAHAAAPIVAAPAGTLIVVDNGGKEHKLTTWKFIAGTRRLSWLASEAQVKAADEQPQGDDPKKPAPPPAPTGPEALVLREESSTDLKDGIFTFIPIDRVKSIEYDNEKRMVSVTVAVPGEKGNNEEILRGSTKYVGENKLTIEAESDLGDLGVAAVKFQGGTAKGVKSIHFPPPQVKDGHITRLAEITIAGKNKEVHKVTDVTPLYQLRPGVERLSPTLLFKKTVKIDLAKVQKLALSESGGLEFDVTLKDGKTLILTLLDKASPFGGKDSQLIGFVAKVAVGYKIYPVKQSPNNTFTAILLDPDKVEADKEDTKKETKN